MKKKKKKKKKNNYESRAREFSNLVADFAKISGREKGKKVGS